MEQEYKRIYNIMEERYNFVVDLLNEEQQIALRQWYVDTGVIEEE